MCKLTAMGFHDDDSAWLAFRLVGCFTQLYFVLKENSSNYISRYLTRLVKRLMPEACPMEREIEYGQDRPPS